MADFRLQIVTQQKTVFNQDVTAATLPGEDGFFGVLAHHAAIIAVLRQGPVVLRQGTKVTEFLIDGGFFEMESNKATLLADGLSGLAIAEDE